jgi:hypothetical protein
MALATSGSGPQAGEPSFVQAFHSIALPRCFALLARFETPRLQFSLAHAFLVPFLATAY